MTPLPATLAPRHFAFIHALRGLAALSVMLFHVQLHSVLNWPHDKAAELHWTYAAIYKWFDLGAFGVCVFFILSGFVVPATLLYPGASLKRYAIARFARLYPAFWASIAIYVALELLMGRAATINWLTVAANTSMVHQFFGVTNVIGTFWTLPIELVFYASVALLFALGALRYPFALAIVAMAAAAAYNKHPVSAQLSTYIATGFLGIALMYYGHAARCFAEDRLGARWFWMLTAVLIGGLVFLIVRQAASAPPKMVSVLAAVAIFLLAGALAERFEAGGWPAPVRRVLNFFGDVSYGVYLIHPTVGMTAAYFVHRETASAWAAHAAALAVTLTVSWLTYRFIEKPAIAWGKRMGSRFNARTL